MGEKPVLTLMVGLPGSEKTTLAKRLEAETGAVRFTPDEWHLFLFGDDFHHPEEHALHDARHDRVEQLMSLIHICKPRRAFLLPLGAISGKKGNPTEGNHKTG